MAKDKKMHVICGAVIGAIVTLGAGPLAGVITAAAIGAGKEVIYDYLMGKGTPEWADMIATTGGGVIGAAVILLLGGA